MMNTDLRQSKIPSTIKIYSSDTDGQNIITNTRLKEEI
jgi:hypothetical protein